MNFGFINCLDGDFQMVMFDLVRMVMFSSDVLSMQISTIFQRDQRDFSRLMKIEIVKNFPPETYVMKYEVF